MEILDIHLHASNGHVERAESILTHYDEEKTFFSFAEKHPTSHNFMQWVSFESPKRKTPTDLHMLVCKGDVEKVCALFIYVLLFVYFVCEYYLYIYCISIFILYIIYLYL